MLEGYIQQCRTHLGATGDWKDAPSLMGCSAASHLLLCGRGRGPPA